MVFQGVVAGASGVSGFRVQGWVVLSLSHCDLADLALDLVSQSPSPKRRQGCKTLGLQGGRQTRVYEYTRITLTQGLQLPK